MNKSVPPKALKVKLKVYRPNQSKYFIYKNDTGKNTSGGSANSWKLFNSPDVDNRYTFLMYTASTLSESYQ